MVLTYKITNTHNLSSLVRPNVQSKTMEDARAEETEIDCKTSGDVSQLTALEHR